MDSSLPFTHWKKKLGMSFTLARIILTVPVCLLLIFGPDFDGLATIVFILAAVTDYVDGFFARRYKAITVMGQYLDPVADKILVTSVLVVLAYLHRLSPWLCIIIAARDNFIGALRSAAAAENLIIAAKPTGKWKTAVMMTGLPLAILAKVPSTNIDLINFGAILLWLSVPLSLISGWEYWMAYLRSARERYSKMQSQNT